MKNRRFLLLLISLLLLSLILAACGGAETAYPTGAMTDDATLTLVCGREELVLDAVTLATLVTTELYYEVDDGGEQPTEEISVVFDLLKYVAGEGFDLSRCRTYVLTDRAGQTVLVPVDEVSDSLYIGITSGAENLDYPLTVLPEGVRDWQLAQLARVEFSPASPDALAAEAAKNQAAAERKAAQEAVAGVRHLVLLRGVAAGKSLGLEQVFSAYLPDLPADKVTVWDSSGSQLCELEAGDVLSASFDGRKTVLPGLSADAAALTYEQNALWLLGAVPLPELFQCCQMVKAEDYTFFGAAGASLRVSLEDLPKAQLQTAEQGGFDLILPDQSLSGLVSVQAGTPLLEDE